MRILHVNDYLKAAGGVESYLLRLCPEQQARGHEVHVLYADGDPALWPRSIAMPALREAGSSADQACESALPQILRRVNPDVVHVHGVNNAGALRVLAEDGRALLHGHDFRPICPASNYFFKRSQTVCQRRCDVGCFAQTAIRHCMSPRPGPGLYAWRRARWNIANRQRFSALLAPSAAAGRRYVDNGFAPERVHVVPYFCPIPLRAEPRPLPAQPCITYIGRAAYNKGWEYFIDALGQLPPSVSGCMVGSFDATARAAAEQRARRAGCADRLRIDAWAGREDVAAVYERTTVLVFPSLWPETMGIVGVEALSQGVPVVASNIGGVGEWLRDGVNGRLAAPGSAGQIAAAVTELLEPAVNHQFGLAGLDTIRERFLPGGHLDWIEQAYRSPEQPAPSAVLA